MKVCEAPQCRACRRNVSNYPELAQGVPAEILSAAQKSLCVQCEMGVGGIQPKLVSPRLYRDVV